MTVKVNWLRLIIGFPLWLLLLIVRIGTEPPNDFGFLSLQTTIILCFAFLITALSFEIRENK
jgi:hypothetical protein